ncbi:phage recombination protein Bet [Azospirillum sp. SYSU D00513]|uniref:phage recombination protein Bet n=1 Tax=Azospirillum sp. SYSU D00513 TaxID=2812561 RepID=UPI001A96F4B9|nr:phage recombination protein Bet [Azospirillum sp. SYSU D00513]
MGEVVSLQPRIAFPEAAKDYGLTEQVWRVLVESTFPSAKTAEGVLLAVAYCKARNLDIMKRPVSIVPMYNRSLKRDVETVWPGVNELQITASRTGFWAGMEPAVFGPKVTVELSGFVGPKNDRKEETVVVTYPEWCEVTVYRLVGGVRCPFTERVYWTETYSRAGYKSVLPTDMWVKRPKGQLAKCAKAASLRAAFPEECGYSAEEMAGKVIEADEADLPRRSKRGAQGGTIVDINPKTGEMIDDEPEREPDLSQVSDDVKAKVAKLVRRAVPNGAWQAAQSYAAENFKDNDLAYARSVLKREEKFQTITPMVRTNVEQLIQRAGTAGNWNAARGYLSKLKDDGKLTELEYEFTVSEVDLAERAATLPMKESA